jgi:Putative auto-transporter adhesin, head GIN domain
MRAFPSALLLASLIVAGVLGLAPAIATAKSDTVTAEAPPVGPFDHVEITGHAELILIQGDREAVLIEASPKARSRIRVRSRDGRLRIDASENIPWWSWFSGGGRRPTITVHFKTLEVLEMSGAVKVTSSAIQGRQLRVSAAGATSLKVDALNVESLRFSGSGAVKGELAGSATDQAISISGAGAYRAPKLASQTAEVSVSGAGKVIVNVRKKLDASISGAGAIEYFGDPMLKQRISGAGKITRRSSAGEAAPVRLRAA